MNERVGQSSLPNFDGLKRNLGMKLDRERGRGYRGWLVYQLGLPHGDVTVQYLRSQNVGFRLIYDRDFIWLGHAVEEPAEEDKFRFSGKTPPNPPSVHPPSIKTLEITKDGGIDFSVQNIGDPEAYPGEKTKHFKLSNGKVWIMSTAADSFMLPYYEEAVDESATTYTASIEANGFTVTRQITVFKNERDISYKLRSRKAAE